MRADLFGKRLGKRMRRALLAIWVKHNKQILD
jgi:hypothetical protein